MKKVFGISLALFKLLCAGLLADTICIVGVSDNTIPSYWILTTPSTLSDVHVLDIDGQSDGSALGVAFSPAQSIYIGGYLEDIESSAATNWTVSSSGSASNANYLTPINNSASANGVGFSPTGIGYIVGRDDAGNAAYWTVSSSGVVSNTITLTTGGFATAVAFSSAGKGYITGNDGDGNASYWTISELGTVDGPFTLIGGESGGTGTAYSVAFTPSGTAYIVGSTTAAVACFWTILPSGSASSAHALDSGSNSSARGVAFLPSGAGILVGQAEGNNAAYWNIATNGDVSSIQLLPNGSGGDSKGVGVVYSSDQTAYIIGSDSSQEAVYWTLPISGSAVRHSVSNSRSNGNFYAGITISLSPNPPSALTARYETNDFALLYERYASLKWTLSDSSGVVAYNIYKNGVKIATVNSTTTHYNDHNQRKSESAVYTVTAVNAAGNESTPVAVTLN